MKLEQRSWRSLAIKLADNLAKAQQGRLEPIHVQKYVDAINHKQNIENGHYIEDGRTDSSADASGEA